MFSYYGSKCKIAKFYPPPKHGLIIEPFAGAAWYSFLHRDNDVILNDRYIKIFKIWEFLIKKATPELILKYKDFYLGEDIRLLKNLNKYHRYLIGYCINRGSVKPRNIVQNWSCQSKFKIGYASTVEFQLKRIANCLNQIKHFKIEFGDYLEIDNQKATWFIDPPYQYGGSCYVKNKIDYKQLYDFCMTRKGQVIVCENLSNTWIKVEPLVKIFGQKFSSTEGYFLKNN